MILEVGLAVALLWAYRRMQVSKLYPLMADPVNPNANDHPILNEQADNVQHQPTNNELQTHYDMMYEMAYPQSTNKAVGPPTQHIEVDWHGEARDASHTMKTDPMTLMHPVYTTYA